MTTHAHTVTGLALAWRDCEALAVLAAVPDAGQVTERWPDLAVVAASLRAVLAAVDAGQAEADEAQRAYLKGAAGTLEAVAAQ